MVFRSMPALWNHAANRLIRMYSGKPEENPVKMQISKRRLKIRSVNRGVFIGGLNSIIKFFIKPALNRVGHWLKNTSP
jgi:hypothetical protein